MATTHIPPHNLQAEESVIGAMLLSRDAIEDVVGLIDTLDFYDSNHRHVFDAIMAVVESGSTVDPVTIADELTRTGLLAEIGGPGALLDFQARCPAISNVRNYVSIVADHSALRQMITVGQQMMSSGFDMPEDVPSAIEACGRLVDDLAAGVSRLDGRTLADVLAEFRAEMDSPIATVPTGFAGLDHMIGGWTKGDLNMIGAPSGVGKSCAMTLTINAAGDDGRPTRVNNLELSEAEIINRLIALRKQIDLSRLMRRTLTRTERVRRDEALTEIGSWPLELDCDPDPTLAGMKAAARRMRRNHGDVGLWVLENIQLWKPGKAFSREAEVAMASRELKKFAKTEGVPVVAAVQLNNNAFSRPDKRPQMNDMRESTAPYHDSSVVVFLYREGFYGQAESPMETQLIVRKQRNGPTGAVVVDWVPQWATFASRPVGGLARELAGVGVYDPNPPWVGDGQGSHDYIEEF
jgi:replicative DNA helicase